MRISKETRKQIHYIIPIIVFLCSMIVIYFGWIKGISVAKSFYPGHIEMRPSTAIMTSLIAIMMIGFAEFKHMWAKFVCMFSSVLTILVAYSLIFMRYPNIAEQIEKVLGYNYFIKTAINPGYSPSADTMLNSTILSLCGLCSVINNKSRFIRLCAAFVTFSGLLGVLGHIVNEPHFYTYTRASQGMAFSTCLLYVLSGFNIWLLHRRYSQAEI